MHVSKYEIKKTVNHYTFKDTVKIGNFIFDEDRRAIILGEKEFQLRDKLFTIFCFLVYSRGKLVHRDAIVEKIWSNNNNVGQRSLTNAICMLRKILDKDESESAQIVTVSKTGYRLYYEAS